MSVSCSGLIVPQGQGTMLFYLTLRVQHSAEKLPHLGHLAHVGWMGEGCMNGICVHWTRLCFTSHFVYVLCIFYSALSI